MSRLLDHLRGHGEKVAVLTDSQQLSYRQLADAVADTARELGGARRLVLLETRNDLATLVHYLAAMAVGHVVLPVDARRDHTAILQTYEPDVVIDANGIHRGGGRHRRAVAILLIVGSHAGLFELWGGAHLLLGIAGYNFGRFCLTPVPRPDRVRHLRNTIAWIAGPSVAWIAIALMITDDYAPTNLLLANKFLGPHDSMTAGRLWFVEVLVWILVALAALCWLPVMDRLERRQPFAVAVAFLAAGLALRYDILGLHLGRDAWFTVLAFWFFAVGWAAAKASTTLQRAAVTVVLIISLHGHFDRTEREMLVLAGFALLIWLPALRCPPAATVVAGVIAEASLYTYLTHYQVYPLFDGHPLLGVVASVAVGVLLTQLVSVLRSRIQGLLSSVKVPALT
jgi:hypothetical protein